MSINKKTLKTAFIQTIPVLMGYSTMGAAFGILLNKAGFNPLWALFMSAAILSGSLQFAAVSMMCCRLSILETALMSLVINIRYSMYGLSLIEPFKSCGLRKFYMIFCLSDETYALQVQDERSSDIDRNDFMLLIGLFDHIYWIAGSFAGALAGSYLLFDHQGIEFAMTALFLVILVDQYGVKKNRKPIFIGLGATLIALWIFGGSEMLIAAMLLFLGILIIFRNKLGYKKL